MEIVKNTKVVKLSKEKSTVRGALQRALDDSHREGWKKVIIIGNYETNGYRLRHTKEADHVLLGLLEMGKGMITHA